MARVEGVPNWKIQYEIVFESVIRGHHIYKNLWTSNLGESLPCYKDDRAEAKEFDEHAVGVYKNEKTLVGHVPIELSFLMNMFLKANKDNGIIAEVNGGRKRENGFVVPCLYKCRSKNKKIAEILIKEVSNSSEKYQHMDIILKKNILEEKVCFY